MKLVYGVSLAALLIFGATCALAADKPGSGKEFSDVIRSAKSGAWSDAGTWEGKKVPADGARVHVRQGHTVTYDVKSEAVIRCINVAGVLTFARDKNTRLEVGLIKIQESDAFSEEGFDCDAHVDEDACPPRSALEVGTPDQPIGSAFTALIRLVPVEGLDTQSCPAIVCCGGRMDFHGTPMNRTWVKLGETVKKDESIVTLAEAVTGWRVGDKVILTATTLTNDFGGYNGAYSTEERTITAIDGTKITLDSAVKTDHVGTGEFRGEIANLSRNVTVESADKKTRGHTMYHRGSSGSISYAEFRHLGKEGVLGRYSLHFHLVGNTMRGSSVIGASIWDSGNRWLTIHGTNYLVVRDCVGYKSIGHGYFLEDGTEVYNILDRNLAVQALKGKPLPKQVLSFDHNEGAGFWWANSLNTFTRNVTCENGRYGYRFEATKTSRGDVKFNVLQPDGNRQMVDIRTLPFVRFEDNEGHCDGLYGMNLGEGVERVGPDEKHPFVIRRLKLWEIHYAFRPQSPCLMVEDLKIDRGIYGVYHPNYDRHVYKNVSITESSAEPFNRGHDDYSTQYGPLTVDGLTFSGHRMSGMPLIQISDNNMSGNAESHFRNVQVINRKDSNKRALVNLGGGPRPTPKEKGVPVYVHDYFGEGRHAKVVSVKAKDLLEDGNTYREVVPLTGDESRAAEVKDVAWPKLLTPVDDLPPITVITRIIPRSEGGLTVRGVTTDNGIVKTVKVNGVKAKALTDNFGEWEAVVEKVSSGELKLSAGAEDDAGNAEKLLHTIAVNVK